MLSLCMETYFRMYYSECHKCTFGIHLSNARTQIYFHSSKDDGNIERSRKFAYAYQSGEARVIVIRTGVVSFNLFSLKV